jgi:hypothetical protein
MVMVRVKVRVGVRVRVRVRVPDELADFLVVACILVDFLMPGSIWYIFIHPVLKVASSTTGERKRKGRRGEKRRGEERRGEKRRGEKRRRKTRTNS